jgi:hypothetical protein
MSEQNLMPVVILAWRPLVKNTLRGFVTITLGAMEITDISVHRQEDRAWAGLPAKPQIDREGNVRKKDGKIEYTKVIAWTTKEAGNRFSESVIAALEAKYPDATR